MNCRLKQVPRIYRAMTLLLATVSTIVLAQQVTITPNYKEADIRQIVEAVGAVTDKNFIIDRGLPVDPGSSSACSDAKR